MHGYRPFHDVSVPFGDGIEVMAYGLGPGSDRQSFIPDHAGTSWAKFTERVLEVKRSYGQIVVESKNFGSRLVIARTSDGRGWQARCRGHLKVVSDGPVVDLGERFAQLDTDGGD